jgi:tripartite-type tricarboxylate transporter receptor subunit TctC
MRIPVRVQWSKRPPAKKGGANGKTGGMNMSKIGVAAVAAFVAVALSPPAPARADSVKDFYTGRTIELYIGYSAGGGYDTYARTIARHLPKHIPGNPTIVPKNMKGAGSLKLTNYLYNVAAKDGSVIGTIGRGMPMEPLLGGKGVQFDPQKFNWIGSANNEVSICGAWHKTGIKTWGDVMAKELIVGGTGSGADTDTFPLLLKNMFGAKLKLISGYPGGNDILLAMERGEVGGRCGWSWSSVKAKKRAWITDGKVNVFLQMSVAKHPDLPDVPLVMDLAKTEEEKQILKLIFARQVMGRPYVAPPGVPAERIKALRQAFDATLQDPEFLAEASKSKLEINLVTGPEIEGLLKEIYAAPKEIAKKATQAAQAR